jgi:hypothetical protein
MDIKRIESLLEKYLNAETNLQEETILNNYFTNNNVESHLKVYQPLFSYFNKTKKETYTKTIKLESKRKVNKKWLSVAASIMLMVSVYSEYYIYQKNQAKETYRQTQQAFELLSTTLNKGSNAVGQLKTLENTKNKIFKQ